MFKKFLGLTLTILLCLLSSGAFANSNVKSSSKEITTFTKTLNTSSSQNGDYKKLLTDTNIATQNNSNDLLKSEKIIDSNIIQEGNSIKTNFPL